MLAELVAGLRERERNVSVEALQAPRATARAADAGIELGPETPLQLIGVSEARGQCRFESRRVRPALDTAGRLQSRHLCDEVRAREPVRRRERRTNVVVRSLLRYGRSPERAADRDPSERTWRAAELTRDDLTITFHSAQG